MRVREGGKRSRLLAFFSMRESGHVVSEGETKYRDLKLRRRRRPSVLLIQRPEHAAKIRGQAGNKRGRKESSRGETQSRDLKLYQDRCASRHRDLDAII